MTTIYQLHANDLSASLVDSIKAVFYGQSIQISVTVLFPEEKDKAEEEVNWKNNIDFWMGDEIPY